MIEHGDSGMNYVLLRITYVADMWNITIEEPNT